MQQRFRLGERRVVIISAHDLFLYDFDETTKINAGAGRGNVFEMLFGKRCDSRVRSHHLCLR